MSLAAALVLVAVLGGAVWGAAALRRRLGPAPDRCVAIDPDTESIFLRELAVLQLEERHPVC